MAIKTKNKSDEIEEVEEIKENPVEGITRQRNFLITTIRPLLLTKRDLWKGGSEVRAKHSKEASSYQYIMDEINVLGRKLEIPDITLEQIRVEG